MKDFMIFSLSILCLAATFSADLSFIYMAVNGMIKTIDPILLTTIGTVLGNLNTLSGGVAAYWFGTTKSSSEKDKTIKNLTTGEVK